MSLVSLIKTGRLRSSMLKVCIKVQPDDVKGEDYFAIEVQPDGVGFELLLRAFLYYYGGVLRNFLDSEPAVTLFQTINNMLLENEDAGELPYSLPPQVHVLDKLEKHEKLYTIELIQGNEIFPQAHFSTIGEAFFIPLSVLVFMEYLAAKYPEKKSLLYKALTKQHILYMTKMDWKKNGASKDIGDVVLKELGIS